MNSDLQHREAELEAELADLGPLLDPDPLRPAAIARLQAVTRAACLGHRRQLRLRRYLTVAAAAAAALIAVTLPTPRDVLRIDEAELLDTWVEAATESSATFTILYERPLLDEAGALFDEQDGELSLEIIDQSLQAFDGVFGA